MQITTNDPARDFPITVGEIVGEKFVKRVMSERHKLRMFPAYGIQQSVFDKLPGWGVTEIVIHEDGKRIYSCPWETWNQHAVTKNIGHGDQSFLSLKFMKETEEHV